METRYAMIKVEVQVILLPSRGIFYLDLFMFLFFSKRDMYLSVYLKATSSCRVAIIFNHNGAVFL